MERTIIRSPKSDDRMQRYSYTKPALHGEVMLKS